MQLALLGLRGKRSTPGQASLSWELIRIAFSGSVKFDGPSATLKCRVMAVRFRRVLSNVLRKST
jgi:hypothetical protein